MDALRVGNHILKFLHLKYLLVYQLVPMAHKMPRGTCYYSYYRRKIGPGQGILAGILQGIEKSAARLKTAQFCYLLFFLESESLEISALP